MKWLFVPLCIGLVAACSSKKEHASEQTNAVGTPAPNARPEDKPPPQIIDAAILGPDDAAIVDAAIADAYVPGMPAGKVQKLLRGLVGDLPIGMEVDACDELCMVEAVCSEHVSGEDYSGGIRCMDLCESSGNGGMRITEECVRVALTCAAALECFE